MWGGFGVGWGGGGGGGGGGGRRRLRHAVAIAFVPNNSWLKPKTWLDGAATASNTLYRQLTDSCLNSWPFAEWTGGSCASDTKRFGVVTIQAPHTLRSTITVTRWSRAACHPHRCQLQTRTVWPTVMTSRGAGGVRTDSRSRNNAADIQD